MVNLAGPRPLGNSIESMDLGFALQARCLEAVAHGDVGPADCVVPVPRSIDAAVARAYVNLASA
jgi:adenosylhomocysteinase